MNPRELLAATDAIYEAEMALRHAAAAVDELGDVAASSLRVLEEAATDAFYAHQEERRDFYLESAGDHLTRLRNRSVVMSEVSDDLTRHLTTAGSALERAGYALTLHGGDGHEHDSDVRELRTHIEVLTEVVRLARPVADQITHHAQHVADSAIATDALMLLDERVHHAGQDMSRAREDVSIIRSVVDTARTRAQTSVALAGSLAYADTSPQVSPPPEQPAEPSPRYGIAI